MAARARGPWVARARLRLDVVRGLSYSCAPGIGGTVKKAKPLPHRNRGKSARHRSKLKAKRKRMRLRKSSGERTTYR